MSLDAIDGWTLRATADAEADKGPFARMLGAPRTAMPKGPRARNRRRQSLSGCTWISTRASSLVISADWQNSGLPG